MMYNDTSICTLPKMFHLVIVGEGNRALHYRIASRPCAG